MNSSIIPEGGSFVVYKTHIIRTQKHQGQTLYALRDILAAAGYATRSVARVSQLMADAAPGLVVHLRHASIPAFMTFGDDTAVRAMMARRARQEASEFLSWFNSDRASERPIPSSVAKALTIKSIKRDKAQVTAEDTVTLSLGTLLGLLKLLSEEHDQNASFSEKLTR
ncbi:hypothetical protein [uncultured Marivita sp.]|uniref:hypothetical protein n=1 Tax=uncultured Marivita sp. TaxID=888080 RepID=UPI002635BC65|nr:hypothetical protein [uncultured Marivita sp.]